MKTGSVYPLPADAGTSPRRDVESGSTTTTTRLEAIVQLQRLRPAVRAETPPRRNIDSDSTTATQSSTTQVDAIAAWLDLLYSGQSGYMELCTIDGPADDDDNSAFRRRWRFYSPAHAPAIAREAHRYASKGLNVYISSGLYSEQKRRAALLPSAVIFLDDAPTTPELPYSAYLQTSNGSRHAYYLLDHPVGPAERRLLSGMAAAALGADASGVDLQQIVRLPFTINHKTGYTYQIGPAIVTQQRYTAEQLRQRWQAHEQRAAASAALAASLDDCGDYAELTELGEALLRGPWLRKSAQTSTPLGRLLRRETVTIPGPKGGAPDSSPSAQRAALAYSLAKYSPADEHQIAAIVCAHGPWKDKDSGARRAALATVEARRYVAKFPKERAGLSVCGKAGAVTPQPHLLPKLKAPGRPAAPSADDVLHWYQEHLDAGAVVLLTLAEAAARMGLGRSTLAARERELRQQGRLIRRTSKDRQRSAVQLLGSPETTPSVIQETPVADVAIDGIAAAADMDLSDCDALNAGQDIGLHIVVLEYTHAPLDHLSDDASAVGVAVCAACVPSNPSAEPSSTPAATAPLTPPEEKAAAAQPDSSAQPGGVDSDNRADEGEAAALPGGRVDPGVVSSTDGASATTTSPSAETARPDVGGLDAWRQRMAARTRTWQQQHQAQSAPAAESPQPAAESDTAQIEALPPPPDLPAELVPFFRRAAAAQMRGDEAQARRFLNPLRTEQRAQVGRALDRAGLSPQVRRKGKLSIDSQLKYMPLTRAQAVSA